jgi:putative ATP-binding cassette transporter
MDTSKIPHKITVTRFVRAVKNFAVSEDGWKAKWMFAGLIALLCGINGMNVVNSYVGRDFMTAIADRNKAAFVRQALFYIGVFAASTLVSVVARFTEERLGLLWRQFVTRRAVTAYLTDGTYYRLQAAGALENPDQRIAEDVRAFTVTTLSFVLMLLNSSFTMVAFSGVLWSISPVLFIVAVLYAACGSYLTIALGRPLVRLNYDQLDKEANFRRASCTCAKTPKRSCSRTARSNSPPGCCSGLMTWWPIFAGSSASTAGWASSPRATTG